MKCILNVWNSLSFKLEVQFFRQLPSTVPVGSFKRPYAVDLRFKGLSFFWNILSIHFIPSCNSIISHSSWRLGCFSFLNSSRQTIRWLLRRHFDKLLFSYSADCNSFSFAFYRLIGPEQLLSFVQADLVILVLLCDCWALHWLMELSRWNRSGWIGPTSKFSFYNASANKVNSKLFVCWIICGLSENRGVFLESKIRTPARSIDTVNDRLPRCRLSFFSGSMVPKERWNRNSILHFQARRLSGNDLS